MTTSIKETELLIIKLRDKYAEYASKYSSKWFPIDLFEERLELAIKNRMNLEGFILAEITNFEKIKASYEKKTKERSFAEQVDRMIEKNIARIKKYPQINFHSLASLEISHFYGALSEFAIYYYPILWQLVTKTELRNFLQKFEEKISFLAVPRGKKHSKRIEDHALILTRNNKKEIDIEKDKNDYLKESAFLLHEIIDYTNMLINIKNSEWESPLKFDQLYIKGEKRQKIINNFSNLTGYGAILKIQDNAQRIIDDFRLRAFRKETPTPSSYRLV